MTSPIDSSSIIILKELVNVDLRGAQVCCLFYRSQEALKMIRLCCNAYMLNAEWKLGILNKKTKDEILVRVKTARFFWDGFHCSFILQDGLDVVQPSPTHPDDTPDRGPGSPVDELINKPLTTPHQSLHYPLAPH